MGLKLEKALVVGLLSLTQVGCSIFGSRTEETPQYEVLVKDGDKEIRSYKSYIVAKTEVQGEYKEAQSAAFRILADYIFGNNRSQAKIAMTAPVEQRAAGPSEKIAMTAPVEQSKTERGWVMSFMMPSKYSAETLPEPVDSRVQFEQIEAKKVAVIQYSGSRSEKANEEKAEELRKWVDSLKGYEIISASRSAGYDPPWTLPPFRRNEMHFDVK
jgi:hypothetical protein